MATVAAQREVVRPTSNARQSPTVPEKASDASPLGRLMGAIVENAPLNIMVTDENLTLIYMNSASLETLRRLERHLPVRADSLIGQSIDIFHKDPTHQRRLLSDPRRLPHTALISVGPETLELVVKELRDQTGRPLGFMATWSVVTERIALKQEADRLKAMVENAPINMMLTDLDTTLVYMNPASTDTLRRLEHLLPTTVDKMIGQSIDIFHKNPSHQRRLLASPDANLPHRAVIDVGPEKLELLVTAIKNSDGEHIGAMATWDVVTEKLRLEGEVAETSRTLASAASEFSAIAADMTQRANTTVEQASTASAASEEVGAMLNTVAASSEEMTASIREIAHNAGDAARVAGEAVDLAAATSDTVASLGEASNEVGDVVKVISSIAAQTNLLALNATIEAARAGEAGRGFAVVANEVKQLAQQTAKATEDISRKIAGMQSITKEATEAITQVGAIIGRINENVMSIAGAVEEQTATTNEISHSVNGAAAGSHQITMSIADVAEGAATTRSSADDTQSASASLLEMAVRLEALVNHSRPA